MLTAVASGTFAVDDAPVRIAFNPKGNVWIACAGGRVSVLAPDGKPIGSYDAGQGPQGIAFDAQGNAWVPAFHDDTLYKLTPDGQIAATIAIGTNPKAIAFDAQSNLWVVAAGEGKVKKLSKDGKLVGSFAVGQNPSDLVFDPAGDVWVLTNGLDRPGATSGTEKNSAGVIKLGSDGAIKATVVEPLARSIAVDAAGHLWMGGSLDSENAPSINDGQLFEFDSRGTRLASFVIAGLPNPGGMAIAKDGTLYVTSASGHLLVFSPAGRILARYEVGADPYGVSIGPDGALWVANNAGKSVSKVLRPGP